MDWNKYSECFMGHPECEADRAEMIAEGERLQAKVSELFECYSAAQTQALNLKAENSRLRAALESIARNDGYPYCDRLARAALEGKP